MNILKGLAAAAALVIHLSSASAAEPPDSQVPAAEFFGHESLSEPVISPDGDALALLLRNKQGRRILAVLDTSDLQKATVAASFSDVDIVDVHWVDDKRLVFRIWREDEDTAHQRGSGLYAVERDGSNLRLLVMPDWRSLPMSTGRATASRALRPNHSLLRTLRDGSGDIVVLAWSFTEATGNSAHWHAEVTGTVPLRLDTRSGSIREIVHGRTPEHVEDWLIDAQGRLHAARVDQGGEATIVVPDANGAWRTVSRFPSTGRSALAYSLHSVGPDGRAFVTHASPGAAGTKTLYGIDLETGKLDAAPTLSLEGFDFRGWLVTDERRKEVLGIHYVSDAGGTAWFDAGMKALQEKVDARLRGAVNDIDPADCGCAPRVPVTSYSDRQPPTFYLYDRADDRLISIGPSRPAIDPSRMSGTDFVRIRARDGHDLPVYVTKPAGKGPWPTVVLVHGGPQVRGWRWEWDGESQFLASRGYLVVKPEYRGSNGYGAALLTSGFKQWGLASEDDIADATRWAAQEGLADPRRTCIAGASYGGYATLMGLVRYPDLYQCGVAWAAVTDIDLMYDVWWSDLGDDWKGYGMPEMIGDRVKDAEQLKATSPLRQAAKISRPLLLAHGGVDRRVPEEHAFQLRSALEAAHAPLTWVYYPNEAHGWYKPENRVDFYQRMDRFLGENIGPAAAKKSAHE